MKHSGDILAETASGSRLRTIVGHRAIWPILALALILVVDGIISPGFFQIRIVEGRLFGNLIDILYRAVPTALVALGMAAVIGTKGIDLSVGAIIAIVGAVITWRIHAGDPHWLVLLIALGAGLLCGLWNGFLVAVLDIQPIVATLILMTSGRGIGLMINLLYGGTNPSFTSPLLQGLSVGHIGLIPTRLILFAAIFIALWLLIRRTAFGLFLESVGGNSAAAKIVGINAR
ncbi:MAG TPA: ABC transporter permease, partial [Roseiarcus sp.]|nr:ABC transporter permease [Roseiarcus sp.]